MATYEYNCENGHDTIDVRPMAADDNYASCKECGAPVKRIWNAAPVQFKGPGFYSSR
jgi:putative FmdB family regulatory protein